MSQEITVGQQQITLDWEIIDTTTDMASIFINNISFKVFHHKTEKPFYSIEKQIDKNDSPLVDVTFKDSQSELEEMLQNYV